jgi:hypothetical protein
VDLRLVGDEPAEYPAEAQRVLAQRGPQPVVAGRRRVALVEDEVDDLEDGRQARRQLGLAGHVERHAGLGQRALGPHDALCHRRLRHEECPRDLIGREATEQAQRQRDARLGGQDRVAGRADEPQQVVAEVVVERRLELGRRRVVLCAELAAELLVLALEPVAAAELVDRASLADGHEPGARVVRDA